jgi:uncharacterized RDD family membrane protein YckC
MDRIIVAGREYRYATRFERWLGQFLDGVIYSALVLIPILLLSAILGDMMAVLIGSLPALFYLLFQDGLPDGQSLGKKGVNSRVINATTGVPCNFGESFVRNISLLVLTWIDWVFIFGERRQRLGDKLANTVVVKAD